MAKETNKGGVESICGRLTKPASRKVANAEVDLNWLRAIDYGLFWLYIYIHKQIILFDTNTNVLIGFIISLVQHLFQDCEEHET